MIMFFLCFNCVYSQDEILTAAENFYIIGNFDYAITEYKRFLFFNPQYEKISDIYYKMGLAYRNQGQLNEAIDAIQKSISHCSQDSLRYEMRLAKAIIHIAAENYNSAKFELIRVSAFSNCERSKIRAHLFLGVCHLYEFDWEKSRLAFHNAFVTSPDAKNTIDSLFAELENVKYKSPKSALLLSTFIPGLGQIYSGNYYAGIKTLAINLLTGYLTLESFYYKKVFQAVFLNTPFFLRYYDGNRFNAKKYANLYNMNVNKNFAYEIFSYLNTIDISLF